MKLRMLVPAIALAAFTPLLSACHDRCGWWDRVNGSCNPLGYPEVPNLYGTGPAYAPAADFVLPGYPGII